MIRYSRELVNPTLTENNTIASLSAIWFYHGFTFTLDGHLRQASDYITVSDTPPTG